MEECMNRFRRLGAVVLTALPLAGFALTASAQNTRAVRVGVSGGLSIPMGELGERVGSGYNAAGHVWLSTERTKVLGFRGDVSFEQWDYSSDYPGASGLSARSLGFIANAIVRSQRASDAMTIPYVIGGVGLFSQREYPAGRAVDDSDAGMQLGGGLVFKLSGFDSFLEVKYVNVFASQGSGRIPITFGVRF
jgi:hypothetical protein